MFNYKPTTNCARFLVDSNQWTCCIANVGLMDKLYLNCTEPHSYSPHAKLTWIPPFAVLYIKYTNMTDIINLTLRQEVNAHRKVSWSLR